MQVGKIVRFKNPEPSEATDLFVVVECRDTRILVQCINSSFDAWSIKPQFSYFASDLTEA